MKQQVEEAARRWSNIIKEVTEEEWIGKRQVPATMTSGAPNAMEAAERIGRTVIHGAAPGDIRVQVTPPSQESKPALPADYKVIEKGSRARLGSKA
jgi:hypothetical protein